MGQIHIQATPVKHQLRFKQVVPAATTQTDKTQANTVSADQLNLSKPKSQQLKTEEVNLFGNAAPKSSSQTYVERLTTRQTSVTVVGSETVKLEVGTESAAPELLTSSQEPNLAQSLQEKIQNMGKSTGEQIIRTGASLQAAEQIQVQVGMASALDTDQLLSPGADNKQSAIKPGMYVGVGVQTDIVSGRVALDTAFGKPRVEVGTALNAGDVATLGVSYLQDTQATQQTIRVGAEVKASRNTTIGLNVNQPLHQGSHVNGNTAVGLYLNAKFD